MSKILGVHIPLEPKNLAINGALDFWQHNVGNTISINTATPQPNVWSADMVRWTTGGSTVKNISLQRSTNIPTLAQSGFQSTYSLQFTINTGIAAPAAGDYVIPFWYALEGFDYARIHSKTVTFGFWVQASVPGNYNFALQNAAFNRSWGTTFPIFSSNTWEYKTITVALDDTGTWNFDNQQGLNIYIGSVAGSTATLPTPNVWTGANQFAVSGSTNWMATSGATFRVAQFSIVEGSLGFGPLGFQRAGDTIQEELAMCQRFYRKSFPLATAPATGTGTGGASRARAYAANYLVVELRRDSSMRAAPTVTTYNPVSANGNWRNIDTNTDVAVVITSVITPEHFFLEATTAVTNVTHCIHWIADARL